MKPKTLVLMAVAIGCGLVAMLGIQQAMQGGQSHESQKIPVLVATTEIQAGVELTDQNVQFVEMSVESVPDDAVTSREQYAERSLLYPVTADDIIRMSKLGNKGEFTQSTQIPEGMRVISISVNDTHTLSGLLRPGDRVDLLVTFQARSARGNMTTKTKTLLEYVEVFATDNRTISDGSRNQETKAKIVSLLVAPEQVNYIKLAESKGQLALSWRNPDDDVYVDVGSIDSSLLEELEGIIPSRSGEDRESLYGSGPALADGESVQEPGTAQQQLLQELEGSGEAVVAAAPLEQPWIVQIFAGSGKTQAEFDQPEEEQPEPANPEQVNAESTQASTPEDDRPLNEGQDSTATEL